MKDGTSAIIEYCRAIREFQGKTILELAETIIVPKLALEETKKKFPGHAAKVFTLEEF